MRGILCLVVGHVKGSMVISNKFQFKMQLLNEHTKNIKIVVLKKIFVQFIVFEIVHVKVLHMRVNIIQKRGKNSLNLPPHNILGKIR